MPLSPTTILAALAALLAVLGLILLAGRAAKATSFGRLAGTRRLILREALPLDRASRLQLVSCDGRDLLLLTGSGNSVVVGWVPAAGERQP